MKISVIVPIFGVECYLSECIESIFRQTYEELEIILVDDGSLDRCGEICDYYAAIDPRIIVIHKENAGLVSARKSGLAVATGEYVGYVDGDDWVEPEMYRHMAMVASSTSADIVMEGFKKDIEGKCTEHRNGIPDGYYDEAGITETILPVMMFSSEHDRPGIYTYVWNKLFRRPLLESAQNGVWDDITYGEDAACTYPAVCRANGIAITGATHYHYRQRACSMLKGSRDHGNTLIRMHRLHECLYSSCVHSADAVSPGQIDGFLLYIMTSLTGGVCRKDGSLIPYMYCINRDEWDASRKIAIYGAGTVGQHLAWELKQDKDLVLWADPDYREYHMHHLRISSPESLTDAIYDLLIIAVLSSKEADVIRRMLVLMGVDKKKIVMPDLSRINAVKVLQEYYGFA